MPRIAATTASPFFESIQRLANSHPLDISRLKEMGSTLTVFAYDSNHGKLRELQTVSTLPKTFHGPNSGAEVQTHPSGNFVYASNRGHDSIAIFRVDSKTGKLTPLGHQPTQG